MSGTRHAGRDGRNRRNMSTKTPNDHVGKITVVNHARPQIEPNIRSRCEEGQIPGKRGTIPGESLHPPCWGYRWSIGLVNMSGHRLMIEEEIFMLVQL